MTVFKKCHTEYQGGVPGALHQKVIFMTIFNLCYRVPPKETQLMKSFQCHFITKAGSLNLFPELIMLLLNNQNPKNGFDIFTNKKLWQFPSSIRILWGCTPILCSKTLTIDSEKNN